MLKYLEDDNAYFLTYRFGNREGGAMREGLCELKEVALWAHSSGLTLPLVPVRRFRREGLPGWVEQRRGGEAHAW